MKRSGGTLLLAVNLLGLLAGLAYAAYGLTYLSLEGAESVAALQRAGVLNLHALEIAMPDVAKAEDPAESLGLWITRDALATVRWGGLTAAALFGINTIGLWVRRRRDLDPA